MNYDYNYFEEILYEQGDYYKIIENAPVYIKIKVEKKCADYAIIIPVNGYKTFDYYSQLKESRKITNKRLFGFESPQIERGGDLGFACSWLYGTYKELHYKIPFALSRFYMSCNEWLVHTHLKESDKYWEEYLKLKPKNTDDFYDFIFKD